MGRLLSSEEAREFRARHRVERDGRIRDRLKALLLYDQGWTYSRIAEALLIEDETVSRHILEYQESKKLKPENGGSKSKLTPDQSNELIIHLEENTYVCVKDICAYVSNKYGIDYTIPGMTYWLHDHEFSYKKPKGSPAKADPEKQAAFINWYEDFLKHTPEEEPIEFGDGVHPTMATKLSYGWIRTGKDKIISTTASRTRMNLMGSLNLETMSVTMTEHDTIDSSAMELHFQKLREKYPTAAKIHLILDQGPYNTSNDTKKAAAKYGIEIHYLPPYSPNLNPIERLWKVMNEHTRNNKYFKTANEFKDSIREFFNKTWQKISLNMIDRINDNFSPVSASST